LLKLRRTKDGRFQEQQSFSQKRGRRDETQIAANKAADLFACRLVLLDLDTGRFEDRIGAAVPV
jgi:hypothetical protein